MYINYRVIKYLIMTYYYFYISSINTYYTQILFPLSHTHIEDTNCSLKMCHHWNLGNNKKNCIQ